REVCGGSFNLCIRHLRRDRRHRPGFHSTFFRAILKLVQTFHRKTGWLSCDAREARAIACSASCVAGETRCHIRSVASLGELPSRFDLGGRWRRDRLREWRGGGGGEGGGGGG